jgi:hypothetical protein
LTSGIRHCDAARQTRACTPAHPRSLQADRSESSVVRVGENEALDRRRRRSRRRVGVLFARHSCKCNNNHLLHCDRTLLALALAVRFDLDVISHTAFVCPRSRRAMCAAISPTTLSCMQQCGERNASIGTDQHDDCGAVDEDRSRCVRARSEKHTNTMTDDYQEALVKAIEEHPAAVFIVMLVSSGEIDDFRVCADEGWFARWLVLCCVLRDARLTDYRKLNRRLRESRE